MRVLESRIRAVKLGGNPKINNFDNTSIQIEDYISRVDIFMNDIGCMDSAQNVAKCDRNTEKSG